MGHGCYRTDQHEQEVKPSGITKLHASRGEGRGHISFINHHLFGGDISIIIIDDNIKIILTNFMTLAGLAFGFSSAFSPLFFPSLKHNKYQALLCCVEA